MTIHGKSRYPGLHIWARNSGKRLVARVPDGCLRTFSRPSYPCHDDNSDSDLLYRWDGWNRSCSGGKATRDPLWRPRQGGLPRGRIQPGDGRCETEVEEGTTWETGDSNFEHFGTFTPLSLCLAPPTSQDADVCPFTDSSISALVLASQFGRRHHAPAGPRRAGPGAAQGERRGRGRGCIPGVGRTKGR